MCDMTNSYVWHDSFICVTWLTHMCDMPHSYACHDSLICVAWLFHLCAMTHSYEWHNPCIYVTWLIHTCAMILSHTCDMTHSYVCHDSLICVAWLFHVCAMTHLYEWITHSYIYANEHCDTWVIIANEHYGVATISPLLKIVGLFLQKRPIKETIFCRRDVWF